MCKTIIAGGRDYLMSLEDWLELDSIPITEVVSGGARGADKGGEQYADSRALSIKRFPAQWDTFGKSAGYRRNVEMAEYADVLVAFPGGRGTNHMVEIAYKKGLKVYDWRNLGV